MKEWKGSCLSHVTRLRYSSFPSPFPSLHLSFLSLRPGEVSVENGETSSDGTRRWKSSGTNLVSPTAGELETRNTQPRKCTTLIRFIPGTLRFSILFFFQLSD